MDSDDIIKTGTPDTNSDYDHTVFLKIIHIRVPAIFSGFLFSYPSKRFRSNWMAVIIHGIEAPISIWLVMGIVLG